MKESRYNIWVDSGDKVYVFNCANGSLLCLSKDHYKDLRKFLDRDSIYDCSPNLLLNMVYGRMLIPDDDDEITLLKHRYTASCYDNTYLSLTILPSLSCNFNCPYCFENKNIERDLLFMTKEVELALLDYLDYHLSRINGLYVSWYGGEPLLYKDRLFSLSDAFLKRCENSGIEYSANITTNGYLLDEDTCMRLRDYNVKHVQVTLDGPPSIHDQMRPLKSGQSTFWHIIENLRNAVKYLNISIRVNIDKTNQNQFEQLMQILADNGFSGKISLYPGNIVSTKESFNKCVNTNNNCTFTTLEFSQIKRIFDALATKYGFSRPSLPMPMGAPCTAVRRNEYVIGPNGELYKCWMSVGYHSEVVGNIRDYHKTNENIQKWVKYSPFDSKECTDCIALPVCMGGCANNAINTYLQDKKCNTFRYDFLEQIKQFIKYYGA